MQEQPRRAVPSPISSGNTAPLSLSPKNSSESNTANGTTPVPTSGRTSQMSSPKSPMSPVQEEIQRVRKQIEDMADELKDAFANEKYDDVRTLGEKKKDLEDKLKSFEEQYSNDKHELQGVKAEIAEVEAEMKAAFESESYTKVSELGKRKQDLKMKLAELESSFGLHNAVYQVGDRVSVVGLTSPRGGNYNGVTGTITEYIESKQRYKVQIQSGSDGEQEGKLVAVSGRNLKACDSEAQSGQSKTRALQGEIKLWFPRKHFGFITPDNKPEGEPDIFFHGTHVENRKAMPIKRFARVRFSVIPAPKGPQARDVTIVGYQPEKEAEAEKQAAMASGSTPEGPNGHARPPQPKRPAAAAMQGRPRGVTPPPSIPAADSSGRSWSQTAKATNLTRDHLETARPYKPQPTYSTPERPDYTLQPRNAMMPNRPTSGGRQELAPQMLQNTPNVDEIKKRRGKRQRGSRGGRKKRKQKEARARRESGIHSNENRKATAGAPGLPNNATSTQPAVSSSYHSPPPSAPLAAMQVPVQLNPAVAVFSPKHHRPMADSPPKSPGRGDEPNWRRQNARSQEVRSSPTKAKRPPPGFGNKPPGLSPISVSRDMPTVSQSMPMAGGLPPISTAMQSLDSDDEFSSHAPHPAPQRPDRQSQRGRSYGSSTGDIPRHPQAPAQLSHSLRTPQVRQFSSQGFATMTDKNLTRLPSCTTDELPSFEMNTLERWESIMSTESMHFSDNPSPLGPVSARGEPNPNGSNWRPPKQDSPRERLIRRAEQLNINNSFRRGGPS